MDNTSAAQARNLERLALAFFGNLSVSELKLIRAAPKEGTVAVCGPSDSDSDPNNDPKNSENWGPERQINADVIRWLCIDKVAKNLVDPQGIRIHGAKIVDDLYLSHVVIPFPLSLWRCAFANNAHFRHAEVPGVDLRGCWVRELDFEGVRVRGDVFLRDHFHAEGKVSLIAAQIDGDLDCSGGMFANPPTTDSSSSGVALVADGINVAGQTLLTTYPFGDSGFCIFHAEGEVSLLQAQIGKDLNCSGGIFVNPAIKGLAATGKALSADAISVKGNVVLSKNARSKGFYAQGEVRLLDAVIGNSLDCQGGTFLNASKKDNDGALVAGTGAALTLERATVKGDVFLTKSEDTKSYSFQNSGPCWCFRPEGQVSLAGMHIEGNLDLRGSQLQKSILVLERTSATSFMYSQSGWPQQGSLYLDGFVYGRIAAGPSDAQSTLKWLSLQPQTPFRSQPYLQLAKVLRDSGDDDGQRRVLVAMEDHRWRADHSTLYPLRLPLKVTAGYGYRPLWAFWEIVGLSALGWIIYRRSYIAGNIVPTDKDAYESFKQQGEPPVHHVSFSPLIYSLENSLPLVKLGQADKWQPDPDHCKSHRDAGSQTRSAARLPRRSFLNALSRVFRLIGVLEEADGKMPSRLARWGTSPRFLRWFLWVQILLGWLLATLFLAGVTGLIRKE